MTGKRYQNCDCNGILGRDVVCEHVGKASGHCKAPADTECLHMIVTDRLKPQQYVAAFRNRERAVKRARAVVTEKQRDLVEAKRDLLLVAPVKVGDSVPLDTGGKGTVLDVTFVTAENDKIRYAVSVEDSEGNVEYLPFVTPL